MGIVVFLVELFEIRVIYYIYAETLQKVAIYTFFIISVDEIVAFFLLPYLLPSPTNKTTGAKNQKISKASKFEVQQSFIVAFKV